MKYVGTVTLGVGLEEERTIQLVDMLRCEFKDHRVATVAKCEEGNYLLSIEDPQSTGRCPLASMYLSEGSFMSLFFTADAFLLEKGIDHVQKWKEYSITGENLEYEFNFSEEDHNQPIIEDELSDTEAEPPLLMLLHIKVKSV